MVSLIIHLALFMILLLTLYSNKLTSFPYIQSYIYFPHQDIPVDNSFPILSFNIDLSYIWRSGPLFIQKLYSRPLYLKLGILFYNYKGILQDVWKENDVVAVFKVVRKAGKPEGGLFLEADPLSVVFFMALIIHLCFED